jgi:hypothetical protein
MPSAWAASVGVSPSHATSRSSSRSEGDRMPSAARSCLRCAWASIRASISPQIHCYVLPPPDTVCLAVAKVSPQDVRCDAVEPGQRASAVVRHDPLTGGERRDEDLGKEVLSGSRSRASSQIQQDRPSVPIVERADQLRLVAESGQKLAVGLLVAVHTSYAIRVESVTSVGSRRPDRNRVSKCMTLARCRCGITWAVGWWPATARAVT